MEFNKYYQDELTYLRELGDEFAQYYPKLAPFLARRGTDPDIERLLEGFAFLTGRIRQKLDDELPELTEGLFSLLWPHFLRPLPAMSILEFTPLNNGITEKKTIDKGTEIDSLPVDDTRCRFRTCHAVDVYPVLVDGVKIETAGAGAALHIRFKTFNEIPIEALELDRLRIYLHGDAFITSNLYLWLLHHLSTATVTAGAGVPSEVGIRLPPGSVVPAGFSADEELIPYPANAFSGYRLLQEYFSLPQKFLFLEVTNLQALRRLPTSDNFTLTFNLSRPLPAQVRPQKSNFRLYCTPIINLFARDADPIRVAHDQVEYRVRPSGGRLEHYEIFSINTLIGWSQGSGKRRTYDPFISFGHGAKGKAVGDVAYYKVTRRPAVIGRGIDTYVSFVLDQAAVVRGEKEIISLELTCTNRKLPEKLKEGDISLATGNSPEFAEYRNILVPTPALPPPLEQGMHWMLISSMASNFTSLTDLPALKNLLSTYNFPAFYNRQSARMNELRFEGMESLTCKPVTRVIRGLPVRGIQINLRMNSTKFICEGDMYLFASVLDRFLGLYASVNSFTELEVEDTEKGEKYRWKARSGSQPLL